MTGPDLEQMEARMAAEEQFVAERGGQRWIDTFISPYYLEWMETYPGQRDGISFQALADIRARAHDLSRSEIAEMLGMQWRIQVMGAWYAIARSDSALAPAVLRGFEWCFGSLTSGVFVTAALTYRTESTATVLRGYLDRSVAVPYGDDEIVRSALNRLERRRTAHATTANSDDVLDRLLAVAGALQASHI